MLICKDKRRVKAEILWDVFGKEGEHFITKSEEEVKQTFFILLDLATKFPIEAVLQRPQTTDYSEKYNEIFADFIEKVFGKEITITGRKFRRNCRNIFPIIFNSNRLRLRMWEKVVP